MEEENDAFYAVRKGKVIGIYKSLNDRQDQAGVWPFPSQGKSSEKVSPPAGLRQGSKSLGAFLFSQQKVAPTALPDTSPESSVVAPKTKFSNTPALLSLMVLQREILAQLVQELS